MTAGQKGPVRYAPDIFHQPRLADAKRCILQGDAEFDVDRRWLLETRFLLDLTNEFDIKPHHTVLDFGCGVGRMAKAMIERYGCKVVGWDISASMRRLAHDYVNSPRFSIHHPYACDEAQFDHGVAIWALQHSFAVTADINLIARALKPGARFLVLNMAYRCVPVVQDNVFTWANDGIDIRNKLAERFGVTKIGSLDRSVASADTCAKSFWEMYQCGDSAANDTDAGIPNGSPGK